MLYVDKIKNVLEHDSSIELTFHGTSQEAAQLRNHIKDQINTYCIDQVIYIKKKSIHREEELSLRFGLLVPHHVNQELTGNLKIKGPLMVMSEHIQGITFAHNMPLFYLKEQEEIECQFVVKQGCGLTHQKWNPVCGITFKDVSHHQFQFYFQLIGLLPWSDIDKQLKDM